MRGRRCGKAAVIRWVLQDPEIDDSLTALERTKDKKGDSRKQSRESRNRSCSGREREEKKPSVVC